MLAEAARAGEALLAAKKMVKHGEFEKWVEANCRCAYATAREYMRVARNSKVMDLQHFDGGIRAFLDATAERRAEPKEPLPFWPEDAERVLKIAGRMDRGDPRSPAVHPQARGLQAGAWGNHAAAQAGPSPPSKTSPASSTSPSAIAWASSSRSTCGPPSWRTGSI